MIKPVKKAIFPVGGLGTRFLPATKSMPKEMLPVGNKPLIQYAFEEALEAGIEHFIFITGRNKNAINNHFDHAYELERVLSDKEKHDELSLTTDWVPDAGHIAFIRQQKPLGLGHAVWCARHYISDEPIAVLLADELYLGKPGVLKQMVACYNEHGGNIIATADVPKEEVNKYGIIDANSKNDTVVEVKAMVEKPSIADAPSTMAITGRYILQPSIFSYLEKQEAGAGNEIQLTDAMAKMLLSEPFFGLRFDAKRFDCGNRLGFLEANIAYAIDIPELKPRVLEMLKKFNLC